MLYEIMWKNNVEPAGPQMSTWLICIACWVPTAMHTQYEYYILIDFFHCNNGSTNVAQCYVTWTMTVLVTLYNIMSPSANNCSYTKHPHALQYDNTSTTCTTNSISHITGSTREYRGADKSLARPGRKQATATEDFDIHISYL
jgi:hypothetical protein